MKQINSDGGCLCGDIRYRVTGANLGSAACHCRDCQYLCGGAPAYVVVVAKTALEILQGKPATFVNTAAGGAERARRFCPTCGTPLFAENSNYPLTVSIKVGSLDDAASFMPEAHFWMASAPSWHVIDPAIRAFPRGPGNP